VVVGFGREDWRPGPYLWAFSLASALQLVALTGKMGRVNLHDQDHNVALWHSWSEEQEPRFAAIPSFNLPWLNAASPPFVVAFNYAADREAGRSFEGNGIGGLVNRGFFKSLLLPASTADSYDGGSLREYVRGPTVDGYAVFRRSDK